MFYHCKTLEKAEESKLCKLYLPYYEELDYKKRLGNKNILFQFIVNKFFNKNKKKLV